ncbi:precorrin-6y C5,15-methyltransferase (decarboxylating) subunit CbiE [Desulfogranum japonicum]|uniref:precorrin-6y C5,15-methyltransferase (decarboxylating) subunit CbiE n=1 Tax=Desulfogranum japonicum TaxID=231447 RepID=UPI0004091351|nr:precorrin-6y C5,15-methyltransferase (decarboxylating) subunit CbiE [Desulfogranum japonicum]
MNHIELIGICGSDLSAQQKELLAECPAVVASKRHQEQFGLNIERCIPIAPIDKMIQRTEKALLEGNVAVLASGDPLFYGIGRTLLHHFPAEQITVHPALSALQLACARFKTPWDDLTILSLHGRSAQYAASRVLAHEKVMLFTDHRNSPDTIASTLMEHLTRYNDLQRLQAINVRVAENLGLEDERLTSGTLEEIAALSFSPLNMMLVTQPAPACLPFSFGLQEHEVHHSRGLITKDEVRAASLHKLRLPKQGVLWDVGGGSGSVSLEAARMCPELAIYTIEKKQEEQNNIRKNILAYNACNIHVIDGEAPDALAGLPAPDRVFIGGSGKRLENIIELAAAKLPESGRIVVNAVLKKTAELAPQLLHQQGLLVETATVSVTRTSFSERETQQFNPITIITGCKKTWKQ